MSRKDNTEKVKIPEHVRVFAKMNWKDFKKENKKYFSSKKELKKDYFITLTCDLPYVIDFVIRNGHIQDPAIQKVKNKCYQKFASGEDGPKYVEYLTKSLKHDYGRDTDNIMFLPIMLHEMIGDILKYNENNKDNPEEQVAPPDDLFKLSETILEDRLSKAKKKDIPEDLAFDLLGIIPIPEATKYSRNFRIRMVFLMLYKYSANCPNLNFGKIMKFLFNKEDYEHIIRYALQERKDRCKNFNESQKVFFDSMNEWIFDTLENMDDRKIYKIIKTRGFRPPC